MAKKYTFFKEYDGESIVDIERDLSEQWEKDIYEEILDEHGIMKGTFRVSIVWCSEDDCDCVGFQHNPDCLHLAICF